MSATPAISLTEARLLAVFAESTLYGAYIVTCVSCGKTLLRPEERQGQIRWVMVLIAAILFLIASLHLSLSLYQILKAFVFYDGPGGAIVPLMDITSWDNVLTSVLAVLQCTIGDAIPIYRVYVVYDRSWWIIFPSICLFLGSFACTIYFTYLESTIRVNLINVKLLVPEATAFWALTVSQNIISTSLLVYRIWGVSHRMSQFTHTPSTLSSRSRNQPTHSRLDAVMKIIAASGALYTIVALLAFIAIVRGSVFGYPLSDMAVVVVGIAFNLIITRSSKAFHENDPSTRSAVSSRATSFGGGLGSKHNTLISFPSTFPGLTSRNTHIQGRGGDAIDGGSSYSLPLRSPTSFVMPPTPTSPTADLRITVTRHEESHSDDDVKIVQEEDNISFAV